MGGVMIESAQVEFSKEEAGIVVGALESAGFQGLNPARVAVAIIEKFNRAFTPKQIEIPPQTLPAPLAPNKAKRILKNQVRRG